MTGFLRAALRKACILIHDETSFKPLSCIKIHDEPWLTDVQLAEALRFAGITEPPAVARRGFEFAIEALVLAKCYEREADVWRHLAAPLAELYPSDTGIALQVIATDRREIDEIDMLLPAGELARRIDRLTELLEGEDCAALS